MTIVSNSAEQLAELSGRRVDEVADEMVEASRQVRAVRRRRSGMPVVDVDEAGVMLWTVDAGMWAGGWIATLEPDGAWLVSAEAANGMGGVWVLPLHTIAEERRGDAMRQWLSQLLGPKLGVHVAVAWARTFAG